MDRFEGHFAENRGGVFRFAGVDIAAAVLYLTTCSMLYGKGERADAI